MFAGTAVATQVPYPVVPADARTALTFASVLTFAAASTTHAVVTRGGRWALTYLGTAVGVAMAAEASGVHTGWPFGVYSYAGSLGPDVAGVPAVVPLAWAMMAYPALTLAQHVVGRVSSADAWPVRYAPRPASDAQPTTNVRPAPNAQPTPDAQPTPVVQPASDARPITDNQPTTVAQPRPDALRTTDAPPAADTRTASVGHHQAVRRLKRLAGTALAGGLLLTGWDLFLDPQMVAEGHWVWTRDGPTLNGIPLTNAAGWLVVGTVLTGLLAALPDRSGRGHGNPPAGHPTPDRAPQCHPPPAHPRRESPDHGSPRDNGPGHDRPPQGRLPRLRPQSAGAGIHVGGVSSCLPGVRYAASAIFGCGWREPSRLPPESRFDPYNVADSGPETGNARGADRQTPPGVQVAVKREPGVAAASQTGTVPRQQGTAEVSANAHRTATVHDDAGAGSVVRAGSVVGMPDDRLPFVLLGWTYSSSVLANLVFFGRPAVALAGGLGMGAVLACALLRTAHSRRHRLDVAIIRHPRPP